MSSDFYYNLDTGVSAVFIEGTVLGDGRTVGYSGGSLNYKGPEGTLALAVEIPGSIHAILPSFVEASGFVVCYSVGNEVGGGQADYYAQAFAVRAGALVETEEATRVLTITPGILS